jgi:serine protease Do
MYLTRPAQALLGICLPIALGLSAARGAELTPSELTALLNRIQTGFVQVECTLRYDHGDAPTGAGYRRDFTHYGGFSSFGHEAGYVHDRTPLTIAGFLIASDRVLTFDPQIHPRFIESIAVRSGSVAVAAAPAAFPRHENAVILRLEKPLANAVPLTFDAHRPGPYYCVSRDQSTGNWTAHVEPLGSRIATNAEGHSFREVRGGALIVDASGKAIGATMNGELPLDNSWRGDPTDWPALSAEEWVSALDHARQLAEQTLLDVTLKFRSPKKSARKSWSDRYGDDPTVTEMHVVAVLFEPQSILVLAPLTPRVTARLEGIDVRLRNGDSIAATFAGSLRDYGAFRATLEHPLPHALPVFTHDIRTLQHALLIAADVQPSGARSVMRFMRSRVGSFSTGLHGVPLPDWWMDDEHTYLFTPAGALIAAPVCRRLPVLIEYDYSYSGDPRTAPLEAVLAMLHDPSANLDPNNVPLSEEQEDRAAWLGIELQDLDQDLARAHGILHLTENGEAGAIVAHVYPDSPAARQGVQPGWILLRLCADRQPEPIAVRSSDPYSYSSAQTPWPPIDNEFNRVLTRLGLGRKIVAEFFVNGAEKRVPFTIAQSPPHFAIAPRYESEPLGLTVKNLTYETRRFLQQKPEDPGVIIADIEQGSPAAIAGLSPYEVITHINNDAVADVAAFEERLSSAAGELRLNVKQMSRSRVVKINLPATEPSDEQ